MNSGFKKYIDKSLNFLRETYSYSNSENGDHIIEAIDSYMELILDSKMSEHIKVGEFLSYVYNLFHYNDQISEHSITVAVWSTFFSIKEGLTISRMQDIVIGSFLHELGKVKIYNKYPHLTDHLHDYSKDDMDIMRQYPIIGYMNAKKFEGINTFIKKIILLHHVWEIPSLSYNQKYKVMSSYPTLFNGTPVSGESKSESVRIVQLADCVSSMLSKDRSIPYIRNRVNNNKGTEFGEVVSNIFLNSISPHRIGTNNRLNTGLNVVIIEHTKHPLKPIVRILSNSYLGTPIINLYENLDLYLVDI